jgi:hypothetical protein
MKPFANQGPCPRRGADATGFAIAAGSRLFWKNSSLLSRLSFSIFTARLYPCSNYSKSNYLPRS